MEESANEQPFRLTHGAGEIRIQLRPRTGPLADVPDPRNEGVVWHRLTMTEAEALRDALNVALQQS